MSGTLGYRTRIAIAFVASLLVGYWTSGREDGRERVRRNVLANLVGSIGIVVGHRLGRERADTRDAP
jgi:hypothetical protein